MLHEDKQYYPEAEQVFGKGVSALIEEEDHQPITTPIIEAPRIKFNQLYRSEMPECFYSFEYMA